MAQISSSSSWQRRLDAARHGDVDVLGQLLQQYWPFLWNLASHELDESIRSKQAASDVVQETFVDAQKSIQGFRGETRPEFEAWLRTMLSHNVQDAWRRYIDCQKRSVSRESPLTELGLAGKNGVGSTESPSGTAQKAELRIEVADTLAQLPEVYQVILRYRYWEHLTFEEIGQRLDKSPDAVRQMWYRALKHFSQVARRERGE